MMRAIKTYIKHVVRDLKSLIMALLLIMFSSCASYDHEEPQHEPAVLKIYVFAPDHPIVTRADNGNVNAAPAESAIHSLSVWVFEHGNNGKKVGYITTTSEQLSTGQATLTMEVSDDFAERQPNVDVYVMANVTSTNCGITLDESTTRSQLDAALIENKAAGDFFGLTSTSLVTAVPADGLPMSGVLKNETIFGDAPVFGVGPKTTKTLTNVKLVRAVSKVQFVFTTIDDLDPTHKHTVESITLGKEMIPYSEYLFLKGAYSATGGGDPLTLKGYRYWINEEDGYNSAVATLMNTPTEINKCATTSSPEDYVYKTQNGQDYESLIETGITNGDLTRVGTYYLRESDKNITGTITYDGNKSTTFHLVPPEETFVEGDFGRNHTWIVYAYFSSWSKLNVITVQVKAWDTQGSTTHKVYNW